MDRRVSAQSVVIGDQWRMDTLVTDYDLLLTIDY